MLPGLFVAPYLQNRASVSYRQTPSDDAKSGIESGSGDDAPDGWWDGSHLTVRWLYVITLGEAEGPLIQRHLHAARALEGTKGIQGWMV